ncbi:hypothetical protein HGI16_08125 [Brevibacterium casei]|uniref:DUF7507 domain-containing protein n=1 Tax=Brevibacterium casei TaxID=33889 RepID=UPI00186BAD46|nr:vWA domain-containing protein [Brevibacterium casei]MBE4694669.1 hypothetical protein [Brevibacterium casei]MBY3577791.1 hypothetical protein [Brevibacterium casei]
MRNPQKNRLTRAGITIAAVLITVFSIVPAAQATSPSEAPIPAEAPTSAQNLAQAEPPATGDVPSNKDSAPTDGETPAKDDAPAKSETPAKSDASEGKDSPESGRRATSPKSVAPQSVPSASGDNAVITVKVGGDRTSETSVKGLQGVKLRLYSDRSGSIGSPLSESWASCTSDRDGDCSFTVPQTNRKWVCSLLVFCGWENQANRDKRFWVVQESAPEGWSANDRLIVGTSSNHSSERYAFRTGTELRNGQTYRSGDQFMNTGRRNITTNSTGTWQNTRRNPALQVSCSAGLRVALVLDLSGSVSNSGALGTLKDASKGMVDALKGTSSSMALYTFSNDSPRSNTDDGRNWPSMSIDPGSTPETIKSRIDAYATGGGTNWDSAMWEVANTADPYDLVVVVTDGMPTYSINNTSNADSNGSTTSFDEIESAVFSANAVKAKGSRVMAVGVGEGVSSGGANLAAISGRTKYTTGESINDADYFQAGWEELADLMASMAKGATCRADIEIDKKTLAYGAASPSPGGAGWTFSATASAPGTLAPARQQTTGDTSTVDYQVKFSTPKPASASKVTIEELLSDKQTAEGWKLDAVECRINGKKISVTADSIGFDVTAGDTVKCTVTIKQTLVPGISIEKKAWDTPTAAGLDGAKQIPAGDSVPDGTTVTWTYLVTNTGKTPLDGITVVDDRLPTSSVKCPKTRLNPGESMTCSASGAVK